MDFFKDPKDFFKEFKDGLSDIEGGKLKQNYLGLGRVFRKYKDIFSRICPECGSLDVSEINKKFKCNADDCNYVINLGYLK